MAGLSYFRPDGVGFIKTKSSLGHPFGASLLTCAHSNAVSDCLQLHHSKFGIHHSNFPTSKTLHPTSLHLCLAGLTPPSPNGDPGSELVQRCFFNPRLKPRATNVPPRWGYFLLSCLFGASLLTCADINAVFRLLPTSSFNIWHSSFELSDIQNLASHIITSLSCWRHDSISE